jgi:hypothetical protein
MRCGDMDEENHNKLKNADARMIYAMRKQTKDEYPAKTETPAAMKRGENTKICPYLRWRKRRKAYVCTIAAGKIRPDCRLLDDDDWNGDCFNLNPAQIEQI